MTAARDDYPLDLGGSIFHTVKLAMVDKGPSTAGHVAGHYRESVAGQGFGWLIPVRSLCSAPTPRGPRFAAGRCTRSPLATRRW